MPARQRDQEDGAWLSIGALSRATGIAVETLRTWENRYGFPVPERKPSGHRVYPVSAVPRLRRVAQALQLGHRAGQVVGASDEALGRLLETSAAPAAPAALGRRGGPAAEDLPGMLRLVRAFDGERLTRLFLADWARMGPVEFLEARVAPLVRAVGDGWEKRVPGDPARALPLGARRGPAALAAPAARGEGFRARSSSSPPCPARPTASASRCRPSSWPPRAAASSTSGTEVPVPQVASLARDLSARAVAVSVSAATKGAASAAALRKLREALPRRVLLVAGGDGAPPGRPGIDSIQSLRDLDVWGRRLAAGLPVAATPEPRA